MRSIELYGETNENGKQEKMRMKYEQLTHNMKIIIPQYDNDGNRLSHEFLTLRDSIVGAYGGASIYTMLGLWVDDSGRIMEDNNFVIEVYHDEPFDSVEVARYAHYILSECRQYAVSIIIDGIMSIFERGSEDEIS